MSIYKEIVGYIEEKILDGTYPKGFMLPAENELCSMFGTSRMTVRKALDELSGRGVVYKIKGKGTFVSKFEIHKEHTLKGFSQIMAEKGVDFSTIVRKFQVAQADEAVAENLRIEKGSPIYILERVRCVYGEPVGIESIYLNHDMFPGFLNHDFACNSLYRVLESEYNVYLSRVEQKIALTDISGPDAKLLFGKAKATALYIEGVGYDKNTFPIEYERDIFNGHLYSIDVIIE